MMNLSTPYPWLDLDIVERNIKTMAKRLQKEGISYRPHIKTHKSVEIARLQLEMGARGITCAKISEAMVMAEAGIKDILVAYPLVGADKMERLGKLMDIADVTVTVDNEISAGQLNGLGESKGVKIKALIEIGAQNQRGGIFDDGRLIEFAGNLRKLPWLEVKGIFTYVGLRPDLKEPGKLEEFAKEEAELMAHNKRVLEEAGYQVEVVSAGSSATSIYAGHHGGITESRAGSCVFNDMNSVHLYTAGLEDCALKIRATVVSIPKPGLATIDAGSKSLSSDTKPGQGYGYLVGFPDVELYKLNEEHGYLKFDEKKTEFKIGQQVDIIPNHACVIGNLHDSYFAFRNGEFEKIIHVDARGKNY